MPFVNSLILAGSLLALALTICGTWLTLRRFRTPAPHLSRDFSKFPVSILKPLKGADAALERNLESFLLLDYPAYEVIFSVAEVTDPARAVVARLIRKHPHVKARLIVGAVEIGLNPKVNNLVRSYDRAAHDLILISDSNVRVKPDYLQRVVAHMDEDVGIVTGIVAGREGSGLGALLEATYLNSFFARAMNIAAAAGRPCVIGKSMLFRGTVAARFGGIQGLKDYLAEDFMAGEAMRMLGLRNVVMTDPIEQILGKYSFRDFWSRHMRWGRIRKAQSFHVFTLEFLLSPIIASVAGALAFEGLFGDWGALYLAAYLAVWAGADWSILRRLNSPEGGAIPVPVAWFLLEILLIALRGAVYLGNTVNWRGRTLRVLPGGLLETAPAGSSGAQGHKFGYATHSIR